MELLPRYFIKVGRKKLDVVAHGIDAKTLKAVLICEDSKKNLIKIDLKDAKGCK